MAELSKIMKPYKIVCEFHFNHACINGDVRIVGEPLYVCDRMACDHPCSGECYLTPDPEHAMKFDIFEEVIARGKSQENGARLSDRGPCTICDSLQECRNNGGSAS